MADRCEGGRVLLIDIVELLVTTRPGHRDALRELTLSLWPSLMQRAQAYRSELPVFLLLGVAYRRPRQDKRQREEARRRGRRGS